MRVIGLAAISADGFLTRHDEDGVSFTSPEDQKHFRTTMRACGATIMGRKTFDTVRERIVASPAAGLLRTVMTRDPGGQRALERPGELEFTSEPPAAIIGTLEDRGYDSVAVLGGREIFDLFVADALLTEWHITVEPRLFGAGTPLLSRPTDQRLSLIEHRMLNADTLLLKYRVLEEDRL
jgi:dihydrofolate reductase